ncbi:MAG: putative phage protein (TIGR02216 family) [Paracoccaceae bacterium]|jgi:uncharacterized phage protein (TIGR02216 family)
MTGPDRFDWPSLMRTGILGLGLRPAQFWELTPAEMLLMIGDGRADAPMGRAGLEALAAQFPDTQMTPED